MFDSANAIMRRQLARFHGRTGCYSKEINMVIASLLLLFNERVLYSPNWLAPHSTRNSRFYIYGHISDTAVPYDHSVGGGLYN